MLRPHGFSDEVMSDEYVRVRVRKKIDFYFINLDLELKSTESVQPLMKELADKVFSTHPGGFEELGMMELNPYKMIEGKEIDLNKTFDDSEDEVGGADIFINEFCELIESLSDSSKEIWDKCHRKEFDLGFQCGNTQKTFRTEIQASTIKRCAELGASIIFTVYPHHNYDFLSRKEFKKKQLKK
jgi:hypothetical protein